MNSSANWLEAATRHSSSAKDKPRSGSRPTPATATPPATAKPSGPTKASDLSDSAKRIEQRMATRKSERERQAQQNRQRYPQTAAFVQMIRSRFENAQVIGFEEAGTTWGDIGLWDRATPWNFTYWTPTKGPGISRGKSRSTSANPTGDRELTL